jgi:hypothetical protein
MSGRTSRAPSRRICALGALSLAYLVQSAPAHAQTSADEARAEALFDQAKSLRDAGQVAQACPIFAESKQLAPGVGVSLHLADCYERLGKTGSALNEFRSAQKLAQARGDTKRAEVAEKRAHALEAKAGQLTVASPARPHDGWQLLLDGAPLAADALDAPIFVDPGDHVVTFNAPGQAPRTTTVHIGAPNLAATVHADAAVPPPAPVAPPPLAPSAPVPPAPATTPAAPPVATPPPPAGEAPTEGGSSEPAPYTPISMTGSNARLLGELALAGAGIGGLVLGTAFVINRNSVVNSTNSNLNCDPAPVDNQDTTGAIISYSVGGALLVTAGILYLTTPHPRPMGLLVLPSVTPGGGGAVINARF